MRLDEKNCRIDHSPTTRVNDLNMLLQSMQKLFFSLFGTIWFHTNVTQEWIHNLDSWIAGKSAKLGLGNLPPIYPA